MRGGERGRGRGRGVQGAINGQMRGIMAKSIHNKIGFWIETRPHVGEKMVKGG
jgi:hypothetical protein